MCGERSPILVAIQDHITPGGAIAEQIVGTRLVRQRQIGRPDLVRVRLLGIVLNGKRDTHQLRLHAALGGTPILGDTLYGDPASSPRLLLHAEELVLPGLPAFVSSAPF